MPSSLASRSSGPFEPFARKGRPSVQITLRDELPQPKINTYTTRDTIKGEVTLSAETDIRFDQVAISFVGSTRTMIERPGYAGPTVGQSSAFHTFLRLVQPIEDSQYPQPRIFEAGRKYTFPFTFVVPERLLPSSCKHPVNHVQVQAAHTHLPPSLGDPMLAGRGSKLLDDMCPQMCQTQYQIRVKVQKLAPFDSVPRTLVDTGKKIRIIPATDEEPPLEVSADSEEFCMRAEKDAKKGALRKKFGRIAVAAAQPKAFRLPPVLSEDDPSTTMATLHLRFDPDNEHQKPPRLGSLWTKLKANTFYSVQPWSDFPSRSAKLTWNHHRGVYTDTLSLASRCVASASWEKHTSPPSSPSSSSCTSSRRSSIQSTSTSASLPGPTACFSGNTYYTATLLVPISLPPQKAYVPTFHSCLASRTYSLDISLSYTPNGTSSFAARQTIALRIPVQIASAESLSAVLARAQEVGVQGEEGEEFFTPRIITPPRAEFVEQARLDGLSMSSGSAPVEPPEYANVPRSGAMAAAF
ncbi:predicted protein [Uncinocarpus reesii 1704]|uniref:Arrestin-like N-terminal domain-containing protein n=1 Tax=Uncinocarpus reesii (strain UAMH 1704) TaxID=336963 RepID=C4JNN1_UNCRE|nr:uncharacterized protein UREG_03029 [Uncinocarpus reesii 1704]EEP78184.1 predicted protein [Uncinocarpus reesii 1704]